MTMNRRLFTTLLTAGALATGLLAPRAAQAQITYEGKEGPGKGKHIVFLAGDEEYRSEEGLPMLAKLLAVKHGFKCTVAFSQKADGTIDPTAGDNITGIEALDTADCCVILLRFRHLPDDKMKHFADYLAAGKPVIALRTSTHAFNGDKGAYASYAYNAGGAWKGGFGQHVLGETWVNHWGHHAVESTRGVIEDKNKANPLLRGVADVWGPTDVYEVRNLPADATVLLRGAVLTGMNPTDKPLEGPKNTPMHPVAWSREYKNESGKTNKILTTTMGAATDLVCEDLRRLVINGVYWGTGLEVPAKADATIVGEFKPTQFGFGKFKTGIKPEDHKLKE